MRPSLYSRGPPKSENHMDLVYLLLLLALFGLTLALIPALARLLDKENKEARQ